MCTSLDPAAAVAASPGTKLVCALGPSSHDVDTLEAMLNAGMVGARIDLTWGGLDFHRESLKALNVSTAAHRCIGSHDQPGSWPMDRHRGPMRMLYVLVVNAMHAVHAAGDVSGPGPWICMLPQDGQSIPYMLHQGQKSLHRMLVPQHTHTPKHTRCAVL